MKTINVNSWDEYKALLDKKKLLVQYEERDLGYELLAPEAGVFIWEIAILKNTPECEDFETNFKSCCNAPLEIKGGASRPFRVAASAQPMGTVERWKGYSRNSPEGEAGFTFDLGFDALAYLRGGIILSPNAVLGDVVSADGVLKANPAMVVLPKLLETVNVLPNVKFDFLSAEAMALDPAVMIRATYTKADASSRDVIAVLDYFQ